MMFGHLSPVRIPRMRGKFNLRLPSLDERVIPARLPKTEVRAEQEPEEQMEVDQSCRPRVRRKKAVRTTAAAATDPSPATEVG
ncbi:putative UPF0607 protein [Pongo abelii]|uniref:putative UPF0607 protein n=1 Tax=Pongo abelii TaxID=9601 RepID=UPI0030079B42